MNSLRFINSELTAAVSRGVRQCVLISSPPPLRELFQGPLDPAMQLLDVSDNRPAENLAGVLERSVFDKLKASVFVWVGGAEYRTIDAVIAALAFIASLPKGSGVILDYTVERIAADSFNGTALDALASRIQVGDHIKSLIQPQAVAAMLRGLGFRQIMDMAEEQFPVGGNRLVSAVV